MTHHDLTESAPGYDLEDPEDFQRFLEENDPRPEEMIEMAEAMDELARDHGEEWDATEFLGDGFYGEPCPDSPHRGVYHASEKGISKDEYEQLEGGDLVMYQPYGSHPPLPGRLREDHLPDFQAEVVEARGHAPVGRNHLVGRTMIYEVLEE